MSIGDRISDLGWKAFCYCPAAALGLFLGLPLLPDFLPVWLRAIHVMGIPVCLLGAFLGMLVVGATLWSNQPAQSD